MEVCAEEQLGSMALGLKNLEGRGSAMLFTTNYPLEGGHRYKARFEYLNRRDARGVLRFKDGTLEARDVSYLDSTTGAWTVKEVDVRQTASGSSRFEFHNHTLGPDHGMYVRSFEVQDLGP
jgi:hypothetical protein